MWNKGRKVEVNCRWKHNCSHLIPPSSPYIGGRGRLKEINRTHTRQDRICMPATYSIQISKIAPMESKSNKSRICRHTQGFPNRACMWILTPWHQVRDNLFYTIRPALSRNAHWSSPCSKMQPNPTLGETAQTLLIPGHNSLGGSQLWNLLRHPLLLTAVGMTAWIRLKSNHLFPSKFRWEEHKRGQRYQNVNSERGLSQGRGMIIAVGKKAVSPE